MPGDQFIACLVKHFGKANPTTMRSVTNRFDKQTRRRALGIVLALAAGCRHTGECIVVPGCPPAEAAFITVTSSSTNALVSGVKIIVNSDTAHVVQCDGQCFISGAGGKYVFDISAPGFASIKKTITVTDNTKQLDVYGPKGFEGKSCDCLFVNRQDLAITLDPAP